MVHSIQFNTIQFNSIQFNSTRTPAQINFLPRFPSVIDHHPKTNDP